MWHEERLLIDGELTDAGGGGTLTTLDPSTGEALGTAADATVADAERAVAAARRAFDTTSWATDIALRLKCIRQLHQALVANQDSMRNLIVSEVGAPLMLTEGPQLDTPVEIVKWYADLLSTYQFTEDLGTTEVRGEPHRRWIEKEAVGVVAAIVPYNFPIQISLAKLVPALAAGCTVVLKGPPETPWVNASLGRLIAEAGLPPGVVNVLNSSSVEVAELLVAHPDVDMVSFTGSTPTGRRIMSVASETVKKVFLELGGKSAAIILDDANLEIAAMFAGFTACAHAGQGCAITTRLLVPKKFHDEVVDLVASTMANVPFGDPHDPAMLMGPLISERQREKVDGYVQGALAEGGTAATGGHIPDRPGFFYEPTLLVGLPRDAKAVRDEIFGPVLAVQAYDGDDDAVAIANDSIFGLSGAVYGTDPERATAVARRIRSGTVSINGGMYYGPDTPFGGYKQSGIGREMGVAGLEEYLELKTLAIPV